MTYSSQISQAEAQFAIFFEQFKKPVHDYIKIITGSHDTAEELTQEVFVRLWKSMVSATEIRNPEQYIFQIARNQCYDFFGRVARDSQLYQALKNRVVEGAASPVEDELQFKALNAIIQKAIDTLSPQRRKVYDLSREQGLSIDEIAERLNLSPNTVKNHLVDSLRQIRAYYESNYPELALLLFGLTLLAH